MALTVIGIKNAPDKKLTDEKGLRLDKKGDKGKWIYRYSFAGRRREMGLGTYPTVSLAEARRERDRWALVLSQGKDPIAERDALREAERTALLSDPNLEDLTTQVFEAYKSSLRQQGEAGRWLSPLKTHVLPKLGQRKISTITRHDVHDVLKPIWKSKHPTAQKAIQRLKKVFKEGRLQGYQCDPVTIDSAVSRLGVVLHKPQHLKAIEWQDIPRIFAELSDRCTAATCLQLLILTVTRPGSVRGARFDEIDGDIWTIPAERMKGREGRVEDFRVPLSQAALEIIERRSRSGSEWVFTARRGQPLSDSALSKFMRENEYPGKPHGFRTSFRTWVQDNDAAPFDVSEAILAHKVGGVTERAYARSDLLERRRTVMERWAEYVVSELPDGHRLSGS